MVSRLEIPKCWSGNREDSGWFGSDAVCLRDAVALLVVCWRDKLLTSVHLGVYGSIPYISNAYGWTDQQKLKFLPSLIECNGYFINMHCKSA